MSILGIGAGAVGYIDQEFQAAGTSTNPQRHFTGTIDLDVVLSPGESLSVFVFRNGNVGSSALNFSSVVFTGYFVDVNP